MFGRLAVIAVGLGLAGVTPAFAAESSPPDPAAAPVAAAASPAGARIWYPAGRAPSLMLPGGQRRVIRSVLNITAPMAYGDFVWDEAGVPAGPVWVRVDLERQLISVFRGGHEIGAAVILYGADSKPTPAGSFKILQKDKDHQSTLYDAPMPYMLRLTVDGVAIHASNVREGAATHGCIGVPMEFARQLFAHAKIGSLVVVAPEGKSSVAPLSAERES